MKDFKTQRAELRRIQLARGKPLKELNKREEFEDLRDRKVPTVS